MDNQQFVKENQKINNFPKNAAAHNLSDYYQEIFDFLTKKAGERYPKRLMEEIDKRKRIGEIFLKTKRRSLKKVKLLSSKTQHFKAIKKFKIFEDLIDNKTYLLILRTYSAYGSELDLIKSKENPTTFDKFVIEESGDNKNLIGYYRKLPTIEKLSKTLNEAHTMIKSLLNSRSTSDYIQDILNWYWPNIYLDCEEFVNKCINCRMHKTHKKKRVVKYIRTKRPYERYQVDLVEISAELNMKNKFPCLLTCIDHFSKYAWAIPIRNKESITVRNAIAQVFIYGYPELIQSDNGKEFTNKTLNAYLERIDVKHLMDHRIILKVKEQ